MKTRKVLPFSPTATWMRRNQMREITLSYCINDTIRAQTRMPGGGFADGYGQTPEEALANLMNVLMTKEN